MRLLADQFVAARDPLGAGDTSLEAMALGLPLSGGQVFTYPQGGVLLRRRRLEPGAVQPQWVDCGYAQPDAVEIESDDSVVNGSNPGPLLGMAEEFAPALIAPFPDRRAAYQYQAARVLGNGQTGDWSAPVRVDFDVLGQIAPPMPMWPVSLSVAVIADAPDAMLFEDWRFTIEAPQASFDFGAIVAAVSETRDWGTL